MKKIIADSSCDLISLVSEEIKYCRIPLSITIENINYVDEIDLNIDKMMTHMEKYNGKTSSACPSPNAWYEASLDSDEVIMVAITSVLSGSYNSALVAKDMLKEEFPDKKVYVVDTLSASGMNVLIVQKLEELFKLDISFEEVCKRIEEYKNKIKLGFILFSIDNFVKNGRVSKIAGFATNALNLTIVGEAKDGTLNPLHKSRGVLKSIKTLIDDMINSGFNNGKIVICHSFNEDGATKLKDLILEKWSNAKIEIMKCSGLCSYYAERHGILIGYEI